MAERKPISKKTRFEVFKRDKFVCQYCGRMAPDVILEVDHITPVAEGGSNKMINLVTSCRDCNRGKGKRKLSDDAELKKQQAELIDLADRREQSEMMVKWRNELLDMTVRQAESICDYIKSVAYLPDGKCPEWSVKEITRLINQFSYTEVYDATKISFSSYYRQDDPDTMVKTIWKIGGICYNCRKSKEVDNGNL